MTGEDVEGKLERCSLATGSSLPNINRIWDLRTLLNSSEKRFLEMNKAPLPDHESMHLERAIINGVSKEIKSLEREALWHDPVVQ